MHVFETLDHQSYMLGKYRGVPQSKNKIARPDLKKENTMQKNVNTIVPKDVTKINHKLKLKELKPPGVDEDDESDEDLSYLL